MSEQDYKAGEKGLEWSPTMGRTDYEAGKSVRDAKEAISGAGAKGTSISPSLLSLLSVFRCQTRAIVDAAHDAHDFVMATTKLCVKCIRARDDKFFSNPTHLVHRDHRRPMVFGMYGMAVCPTCGAIWHRDRNRTVLFKRERVIHVLIKERKSSKKVVSVRRNEKQ